MSEVQVLNKTPHVSLILKKFRAVKAVKRKAAERYSVYEIVPDGGEATATLVQRQSRFMSKNSPR